MLTDVIRVLVNNLFKKSFYEKRKKAINVLTTFFISNKNDVKTFLKLIINYCPALVNIIHIIISPKKKKKKKRKKKDKTRRQSNGFRPRKALDAFQQKQGLFFVV